MKRIFMLGNQNIMAFVITADAVKAREFYEGVLGLKVKSVDEYGINFGDNSSRLRMSIMKNFKPAPYSVLSWVVADIHNAITGLSSRGVVFQRFQGLIQDESGVWTTPDGTQVAWFKDPDENMLSLTQFS